MRGLPFIKMQGTGNDFVLVDARAGVAADWPAMAIALCHRHFGIGADGLLVVEDAPGADARMRMFNPDGTEDFCGNGIRCVARYVAENGGGGPARLRIDTLTGVREAEVLRQDDGVRVRVVMPDPIFQPEGVPVRLTGDRVMDHELPLDDASVRIAALSTGSTHTVIFVEGLPGDEVFLPVSRAIETHPLFPERTSVLWAVVEDRTTIRLRIWERGAGETLGCGTGACAAMVAARVKGLVEPQASVVSAGGTLVVTWDEGKPLVQTGPAEYVFEGRTLPP